MLTITINDIKIKTEKGKKGKDIIDQVAEISSDNVIAILKENKLISLNIIIEKNCELKTIKTTTIMGKRIYQRSLSMILIKAFLDLFPESWIKIQHSISQGLYCTTGLKQPIPNNSLKKLKKRIREIIEADIPFEEITVTKEEASKNFTKSNLHDKIGLIKNFDMKQIPISRLGHIDDLRYYPLASSTGVIKYWDIIKYEDGLILQFPSISAPDKIAPFIPQKKLFAIFQEDKKWGEIMNISNLADLNELIKDNNLSEMIKLGEALHEKKIGQIADSIAANKNIKFIMIAGPSSSGKTTFAKKLSTHLKLNRIETASLSIDNYYKNREETPIDENGEFDFESIDALDLKLFNQHLNKILLGENIEVPIYSFESGSRKKETQSLTINPKMPVIIEGIHGLNNKLSQTIPRKNKFMIYISALTQLNIDDFNRIPTTDNRLLRRIVRDNHYRGTSASDTIKRWPSVRRGEEKNIFPFQESADLMFNSALIYELAILKNYGLPLLEKISRKVPEYSESQRLILFLKSFMAIDEREIPPTSILREFVGKSTFNY